MQGILQAFHQVHLNHCYRETNQAADSLAFRWVACSRRLLFINVTPPLSMLNVLSFDSASRSAPNVTTETTVSDTHSFGLALVILLVNQKR